MAMKLDLKSFFGAGTTFFLLFSLFSPGLEGGEGILAEVKKRGVLTVCVDPDNLPFSSSNPETPGFDVEIAKAIAQGLGVRVQYYWIETFHGDRAIRRSLFRGKCDGFMGLPADPAFQKELEDLDFSRSYFGSGYVLVVREGSPVKRLEDLRGKRIGVEVSAGADYPLFKLGYSRVHYHSTGEVLEAVEKGEVDAGALWAPALGRLLRETPHPRVKMVEGYVPEPGLRWNVAVGIRRGDDDLKKALDRVIEELIRSNTIEQTLAKYGVRFYPPFETTGRSEEHFSQERGRESEN